MTSRSLIFIVLGLAILALAPFARADQVGADYWKGTIAVPTGSLDMLVVFTPTESSGNFTAKLDIPAQGARGIALESVVYTADKIEFVLSGPSVAKFSATRTGDKAEGMLAQSGLFMPIKLERVSADDAKSFGPKRPQTPKPPFPYRLREVGYDNTDANVHLAGTLTFPEAPGPHPAVLLITGSGSQDRDETIFDHKPFAVIADRLSRSGFAVLRVDDRGIGGSTGSPATSTTLDFVGDVLAGVEFLKNQPEIDPKRIALLGHSEGGLIAPLVAARCPDVKAIVLLAGTGIPGRELMPIQLRDVQLAGKVDPENVDRQVRAQRAAFDAVLADPPDTEGVRKAIRELTEIQLSTVDAAQRMKPDQLEAAINQQTAMLTSPWYRTFLKLDPREALQKVACPVLALNGDLDRQVPADINLAEIEKALRAGNNADITIRKLPGLNHLFQECQSGHPGEYSATEQTISPAALDEIERWLTQKLLHAEQSRTKP